MARAVGATPYARRRRGPRWGGVIALLLLAAELASLVAVGKLVGPGFLLLILLVQAVAGFWVIRSQARRTLRNLSGRTRTSSGVTVTDIGARDDAGHAPLGVLGGLLLVVPGFVSDVFAVFLLIPATRTLVSRMLKVAVVDRLVRQWTVVTVSGTTTGSSYPPGTSGRPPDHAVRDDGPPVIPGEVTDRPDGD